MNCITTIAAAAGRIYITPEDVSEALRTNGVEQVRIDVLQVLGGQTDFAVEDAGLCAFIAYRGTSD